MIKSLRLLTKFTGGVSSTHYMEYVRPDIILRYDDAVYISDIFLTGEVNAKIRSKLRPSMQV